MKKTKKRGFTIVELVIVIAVIAILAAVLVPTFTNVINSAKASTQMQEVRGAYLDYAAAHAAGSEGSFPLKGQIQCANPAGAGDPVYYNVNGAEFNPTPVSSAEGAIYTTGGSPLTVASSK